MQSLLVTDIVGSTRLWAEHESAMANDLVVHDELVSAAIASAGGRVFKHTGDGMMATFPGAAASALAAADIQRRLGACEWQVPGGIRVRAGLHSGSVHERNGDLFGPPVNRVARLLSKCPPEAVLVSEATAALLVDGMPAGLSLCELGRVELKDMGRGEVVYSLVGDGLLAVDPADVIVADGSFAGRLPSIDTELVGRSGEIASVVDALGTHGVVSIVGVGGMGKSRLALEAAAACDRSIGAWWCDLAAVSMPEDVPVAVLGALGVSPAPGRTAVETIVDVLASRSTLLVLDNCEHVLEVARHLVEAIRGGTGDTRVLVTSREALGLRGEQVVSLSPLSGGDAIGLFCARALESRPDLDLDEPTLAAIEEICVRLDGIPLAIELAAARCRSMAPAEIAVRLDDRFRFLRGGRGGVERHRTLLATVEWSYSQLDPHERSLFDRLAVFADGALIDAVAQVGDVDEYDALDLLDRLVGRSLVVASDTELGTRYRQLETLRQYGEDRLVEADLIDEVRQRQLTWAMSPSIPCRTVHGTAEEAESFRRFAAELDNLRTAVRYAVTSGRLVEGCGVIAGVLDWPTLLPAYEVIDWIDPLMIPADDWDEGVLGTATGQALTAIFAGRHDRTRQLIAAVPPVWDDHFLTLSSRVYEAVWVTRDFERAEALINRIEPQSPAEESLLAQLRSHNFASWTYQGRADDVAYRDAALAHTATAIDDARRAGAEVALATNLMDRGYVLDAIGDLHGAIDAMTESARLAASLGTALHSDATGVALSDLLSRLTLDDSSNLASTAVMVRDQMVQVLQRGSASFALNALGSAVERVLWTAGDRRTAAVLGHYARLDASNGSGPPIVDERFFDPDEVETIDAEAAELDLDTAGALALAALDQIIASG